MAVNERFHGIMPYTHKLYVYTSPVYFNAVVLPPKIFKALPVHQASPSRFKVLGTGGRCGFAKACEP